ncbi:MAG: carboxypeptidase regulatory-like domain-containing protein, partial [Deltaproteobacteria bacterium]|nr:carboxypeptidase regulatory-like domain-containing protein [Deltaproteobacteria bacterium]
MRRLLLSAALCAAAFACSSGDSAGVVNHGSITGTAKFAGESGDQSGTAITLAGATPGATTTDASGNYSFTGLAAGTYFVTAASADSIEHAVFVEVDVTKDKASTASALTLTGAGSISGTVTLHGLTDHTGTTASAVGGGSVTTGADGTFTLRGVKAGATNVVLAHDGWTSAIVPVTVQRGKTADAGTTDLTGLSGSGAVHGKVVDASSAGVANVTAMLSGPATVIRTTDANGNYSFTQLPAGTYQVNIGGPDVTPHATLNPATVTAGNDTAMANVTVTPVGAIAGSVDATNLARKLPAAALLLQAGNAQGITALVSATGSFLLNDVPAGSGYSVQITGGGAVSLAADAPDVTRGHTSVIATAFTLPEGGLGSVDMKGLIQIEGMRTSDDDPVDASGVAGHFYGTAGSIDDFSTSADGSYLQTIPGGAYIASFSKGIYNETTSPLLALPGTNGLAVDGTTYPLGTLTLQAGKRQETSHVVGGMCPTRGSVLGPNPQFDTGYDSDTLYLADYSCPLGVLPTVIGLGSGCGSFNSSATYVNASCMGGAGHNSSNFRTPVRNEGGGNGGPPLGNLDTVCSGRLVVSTPDGRTADIPDGDILEGTYMSGPKHSVLYFTDYDPTGQIQGGTLRLATLPAGSGQVTPTISVLGHNVTSNQFYMDDNFIVFFANYRLVNIPDHGTWWFFDVMSVDVNNPSKVNTLATQQYNSNSFYLTPDGRALWQNYNVLTNQNELFTAPLAGCPQTPSLTTCEKKLDTTNGFNGPLSPDYSMLIEIQSTYMHYIPTDGSPSYQVPIDGGTYNSYYYTPFGLEALVTTSSSTFRMETFPFTAASGSMPTTIAEWPTSSQWNWWDQGFIFQLPNTDTPPPDQRHQRQTHPAEFVYQSFAPSSTPWVLPLPGSNWNNFWWMDETTESFLFQFTSEHGYTVDYCAAGAQTCTTLVNDANATQYNWTSPPLINFAYVRTDSDDSGTTSTMHSVPFAGGTDVTLGTFPSGTYLYTWGFSPDQSALLWETSDTAWWYVTAAGPTATTSFYTGGSNSWDFYGQHTFALWNNQDANGRYTLSIAEPNPTSLTTLATNVLRYSENLYWQFGGDYNYPPVLMYFTDHGATEGF